MYARLLIQGHKCEHLPVPVAAYRYHPESKTVAEGDLFDHEFDEITEMYQKQLKGAERRWTMGTLLLRRSYQASQTGDTRAVESVRAQDVPESLEIIIVNDGSVDETESVLRSLAHDETIRCITQENSGPSSARNLAIRESRGEWIAFLDGDDYWLPGKLKAQLAALEKEGADFAYCGSIVVDEEGGTLARYPASPRDSLPDNLMWGNLISTPTVIVRRSLLDRTGLFDEVLRTGEDWDL